MRDEDARIAMRRDLAVKVMGWHINAGIWNTEERVDMVAVANWRPDERWDQAGMVAEKLSVDMGRAFQLIRNKGSAAAPNWIAEFRVRWRWYQGVSDISAPLAICHAALAAVDEEEET